MENLFILADIGCPVLSTVDSVVYGKIHECLTSIFYSVIYLEINFSLWFIFARAKTKGCIIFLEIQTLEHCLSNTKMIYLIYTLIYLRKNTAEVKAYQRSQATVKA